MTTEQLSKKPHLTRRFKGGLLKGLTSDFFNMRDAAISNALKKIFVDHVPLDQALLDPNLSECDERAIEYPYALSKLKEKGRKLRYLDAGCVMNNKLISPYIWDITDQLWLLNPIVEKLQHPKNIVYIVNDIREVNLFDEIQFDYITSLSTIEHVGMDNTRYGGPPQEFSGLIEHPEKYASEAVKCLIKLLKPSGTLLLSVPFGSRFEFLYQYERPNKPVYYTFDNNRIKSFIAASLADFVVNVSVYKSIPGHGWIETDLDDQNILDHADGCGAAGAACFIEATPKQI